MTKTSKETKEKKESLVAVVRVRGKINLSHEQQRTFKQLNLNNKNWCIVLKNTKDNLGMINKVKDYVTWGEISEELFEELVKKKGEEYKARTEDKNKKIEYKKYFQYKSKRYNRFFRLHPPLKGYGRKGVKTHFHKRGALGNRNEKIMELLERMIWYAQ